MQDRQLAVCAETLGKLYTDVVWVFVNGGWIYSTVLLFHRLIGRFCFYSPLSEFSKEVLPVGRGVPCQRNALFQIMQSERRPFVYIPRYPKTFRSDRIYGMLL